MKKLILIIIFMFILFLNHVSAQAPSRLSTCSIGYLFEEGAGNAVDAFGNVDASVTGVTYGATGKIDNAYGYDGTNDYVQLNANNIVDSGTNPFTVLVWVEIDERTRRKQIFGGDASAQPYSQSFIQQVDGDIKWWVWYNGALDRFQVATASEVGITTANNWYHLGFVRRAKTVGEIWINATNMTVGTTLNEGALSIGEDQQFIGADGSGSWRMEGTICEFIYCPFAVNQTEIEYIYANNAPNSDHQPPDFGAGGDVTPPTITAINCTSCNPTSINPEHWSLSGTLTFSLTTDENANVWISSINGSWWNCTTTGGRPDHICTVNDTQALNVSSQYVYFNATDSLGNGRSFREEVKIMRAEVLFADDLISVNTINNEINATANADGTIATIVDFDDTESVVARIVNTTQSANTFNYLNFSIRISASGLSSTDGIKLNETFDDGNDNGWTDSDNLFAPSQTQSNSPTWSEWYNSAGSPGVNTLTYDTAINLVGVDSANATFYGFSTAGTDADDYCCIGIYNGTWDDGIVDSAECIDGGGGDPDTTWIQFNHTFDAGQLVSNAQVRIVCDGDANDDFYIDDIVVSYLGGGPDIIDLYYSNDSGSNWIASQQDISINDTLTWYGNYSASEIDSWAKVDAFRINITGDAVGGDDNYDLEIDAYHVYLNYTIAGADTCTCVTTGKWTITDNCTITEDCAMDGSGILVECTDCTVDIQGDITNSGGITSRTAGSGGRYHIFTSNGGSRS